MTRAICMTHSESTWWNYTISHMSGMLSTELESISHTQEGTENISNNNIIYSIVYYNGGKRWKQFCFWIFLPCSYQHYYCFLEFCKSFFILFIFILYLPFLPSSIFQNSTHYTIFQSRLHTFSEVPLVYSTYIWPISYLAWCILIFVTNFIQLFTIIL